MSKLKIVYISSLGHSGSTLLDVMLNQHSDIQSVGEIIFFDEWIKDNIKCTCRNLMSECSFWTRVIPKKFSGFGPVNGTNYGDNSYKLFDGVTHVTGKTIIVDSSKSNQRLNILLADSRLEVKVVHLVRNGLAVINSLKKTHDKPATNTNQKTVSVGSLKGTMRWINRNLVLNRLMKKKKDNQYLMIRYEDLCKNPGQEIVKLCQYLDVEFENDMLNPNVIECHNIGGSRWRFSDKAIKIKLDEKWTHELGVGSKLIFQLLGGWLNKKYGY